MKSMIEVSATRAIAAPPAVVYGIIADYRSGHPAILPPKWFGPLTVVEGGVGAGTRIRFSMKGMGPERPMEAVVAEPVPGRLLTETYPATGGVTSFIVDPAPGGSTVTFRTTWQPRGVAGFLERLAAPGFLRRVYKDELDQLQILAEARAQAR
jgi:uncharacterized protein YndB with AHSA1/START domain